MRIRLALVMTLSVLAMVFFLMPSTAQAFTPVCDHGAGHYVQTFGISGNGSSCAGGTSHPCNIGYQTYEWDCVLVNGQLQPQGVHQTGGYICTCGIYVICC